jgi:hypothetical protein
MRKKFIGLSLSLCILDILRDKVDVAEISAIVTSTAFEDSNQAFLHYFTKYWNEFDGVTVKMTLDKVWPIVCQPRLTAGMYVHRGHYVSKDIWLNTETGELSM